MRREGSASVRTWAGWRGRGVTNCCDISAGLDGWCRTRARSWHQDRACAPALHPLPPSPPPAAPFSQLSFFLPAHSPSVKPCPEADLLQRTASLREPFLSEKPHQGILLVLAGPAVNGVPPLLPVHSTCLLAFEFC